MLTIFFFPAIVYFAFQASKPGRKIERIADALAAVLVAALLVFFGALSLESLQRQAEQVVLKSSESRSAYARSIEGLGGPAISALAAAEVAAQDNYRKSYKAIQAKHLEVRRGDAVANLLVLLGACGIADWVPEVARGGKS